VIKLVIILVLRAISLSHAAEHRSAFYLEDLEKRGDPEKKVIDEFT
jgi:hypothetical protein